LAESAPTLPRCAGGTASGTVENPGSRLSLVGEEIEQDDRRDGRVLRSALDFALVLSSTAAEEVVLLIQLGRAIGVVGHFDSAFGRRLVECLACVRDDAEAVVSTGELPKRIHSCRKSSTGSRPESGWRTASSSSSFGDFFAYWRFRRAWLDGSAKFADLVAKLADGGFGGRVFVGVGTRLAPKRQRAGT